MADDTGGLDSAAQEQMIKETRPKAGGLTLGGVKGVSLEPTQSTDVRNRLLEMIRQREAERSGWAPFFEGLALPLAPEAELGTRIAEHNKRKRDRDQDIFNMQLGVSQLDTETARLAQARAKALQDKNQFGAMLTGGVGNAPATGQVASPQEVQSFAKGLNQIQAQALIMLYDQNPVEATKQMLALTKQTDLQRNLNLAGLTEGTDPFKNAALANLVPGAGEYVDVPDPANPGFQKQVPKSEARRSDIGIAPGPLSNTPAPSATAPAPAPAAPVRDGALPTTSAPVRRDGPLPAAAPAQVTTVDGKTLTSPRAIAKLNTKNPYPTTDKRYGAFEENKAKAALDLEVEDAKAGITLEQKRQEVPIEGAKTEAQDIGKASAAEQVVHSDNVKLAPTNALISKQLETDINAVPGLLGKLNKPTIFSAIMNIADKGVQVGNLGSVSIPGIKDAIVQLDPEVRKDPKKLEAYQRVVNNISKIGLEFARAVNKGMGSMSNYERSIVEQAVGDPTRMNANNLMMKAKALECDAKNAMEKDKLWKQMKNSGYDWTKFKSSSEYKDMERKQFYRTAKAMHLPDAKFPGDQ